MVEENGPPLKWRINLKGNLVQVFGFLFSIVFALSCFCYTKALSFRSVASMFLFFGASPIETRPQNGFRFASRVLGQLGSWFFLLVNVYCWLIMALRLFVLLRVCSCCGGICLFCVAVFCVVCWFSLALLLCGPGVWLIDMVTYWSVGSAASCKQTIYICIYIYTHYICMLFLFVGRDCSK